MYYIAIDLKSFYASVECVERNLDPLTTNLVVADESRSDKTICLAVTPSLKAYGLSGRSRLFEVRQKAKEIKSLTGKELEYIIAPPRMSLYIQYSANIFDIYLKYFAPEDIHVYSIDEVFINASPYLSLYKITVKDLTQKVILDIFKTTGITATAGIGTNLFLCKVAMDIVAKKLKADKYGVRIAFLDELKFRKILWDHKPLTDFWQIGNGTCKRLNKLGIFSLGQLARFSTTYWGKKELYKTFGINAEILIDHSWGYEPCTLKHIKSYKSKTNSLSTGQVLHSPYSFSDALIIIKEMAQLLALNLVQKNFITSSITLSVGYDISSCQSNTNNIEVALDFYNRIVPKPAHGTINFGQHTSSANKIIKGVLQLFNTIVNPQLLIRKINLCANNIIYKTYNQLDLFTDYKEEQKENSLQKTILNIQNRYGKNSVVKALSYQENATTLDRNKQIGGHRA